MMNAEQLKNFASFRELSLRDIEAYCDIGAQYIGDIFRGDKPLTKQAHDEIVKGINRAFFAKTNGTFKRAPLDENKNTTAPKKPRRRKVSE